jgi:glycosyltransferase involved in cell wall biosynthesis
LFFSVVIPCYNQSHFLNESLASLVAQTYPYWEAIIVNDGSTDNTVEVANAWCKKDSRFKFLSTSNNGLSAARNKGIDFSDGDYISLLDADDKYAVTHLESMSKILNDGFDIVFSGYSYFTEKLPNCHSVNLDKNLHFEQILQGNLVPPVSVALKKTVLLKTGGFDVSLNSAEDWDLWIRCYKVNARLGISESPTAFYRISSNSMSRQFLVMYTSLKYVFLQAHKVDERLSIKLVGNRENKLISFDPIKRHLLMCLGVAVVQNKIATALDIFRKETAEFGLTYTHYDFRFMCSYLSFRYNISKSGVNWVFSELYPRFNDFFNQLEVSGLDKRKALSEVFSLHKKKLVRFKWGFLYPLVSRLS